MKRGLQKDLQLFQIRWRRRRHSNSKLRKPALSTCNYFSRDKENDYNNQFICAIHEVGHMALLHYLVPTKLINARIWKNNRLEWEGETIPDTIPTNLDYLAKCFVAGFLAEIMAHKVLCRLSYKECYKIFKTQPETAQDYNGFRNIFKELFTAETHIISEFEYYISIHEEVYGYLLRFGIDRMNQTAKLLASKGNCTYRDSCYLY